MPTEKEQIELFRQACEALGGNRAAARALNNIAERTIRALLAGDRKLHKGFLKDMANALYQHSRKCRDVERQLDPMFWANLTAEQQAPVNAAVARENAVKATRTTKQFFTNGEVSTFTIPENLARNGNG